MALPVDVRDVMRSGTKFVAEREQPVRLAVFVEVDAPDVLIDALREQLRPTTAGAGLQIEVTELGKPIPLAPGTDAVIAVAGTGNVGLRDALAGPRTAYIPVVVVALGDAEREGVLAGSLMQPTADLVVRAEPAAVVERLGSWLADRIGSKRLALAHNFAFIRRAVAEDATKTTAWQNALIGTVTPIPGADMPLMTANQIKMLLQIAAAYGQPLGVDRVKELAAVVAGGYLLRALARQALTLVPVLGWAIKGGVAYSGTVAMGRVAVRYFEDGADLGQLTSHLRDIRDQAAARLPKRAPKTLPAATVALPPATELPLPLSEDEGAGA
jgi:uncharacterized protein (DUF697 family)